MKRRAVVVGRARELDELRAVLWSSVREKLKANNTQISGDHRFERGSFLGGDFNPRSLNVAFLLLSECDLTQASCAQTNQEQDYSTSLCGLQLMSHYEGLSLCFEKSGISLAPLRASFSNVRHSGLLRAPHSPQGIPILPSNSCHFDLNQDTSGRANQDAARRLG